MQLFTPARTSLQIGSLLDKGTEGQIHEIKGQPNLLAKIYIDGKEDERRQKIVAICAAGLHKRALRNAFPIDPLIDGQGRFRGFTMRRISVGGKIHQLYSERDRLARFPKATTRFFVRTAGNLARCLLELHSQGVVIGDINESGILVDEDDALVHLVDCDSFQVTLGGKVYPSIYMTPQYQPPEVLLATNKGHLLRTPNHDAFGLAVMVFRLLMAGRHPFLGRWQGTGEPPSEIEMISAFRYAYGSHSTAMKVAPPLGAPPARLLSRPLRDAFERAFGPDGVRSRPTPSDWVSLLDRFERQLKKCSVSPQHDYHSDLSSCPWCTHEKPLRGQDRSGSGARARSGGPAFAGSARSTGPAVRLDHTRLLHNAALSSLKGGAIAIVPCVLLWVIAPFTCGRDCSDFAWMEAETAPILFGIAVYLVVVGCMFQVLAAKIRSL